MMNRREAMATTGMILAGAALPALPESMAANRDGLVELKFNECLCLTNADELLNSPTLRVIRQSDNLGLSYEVLAFLPRELAVCVTNDVYDEHGAKKYWGKVICRFSSNKSTTQIKMSRESIVLRSLQTIGVRVLPEPDDTYNLYIKTHDEVDKWQEKHAYKPIHVYTKPFANGWECVPLGFALDWIKIFLRDGLITPVESLWGTEFALTPGTTEDDVKREMRKHNLTKQMKQYEKSVAEIRKRLENLNDPL